MAKRNNNFRSKKFQSSKPYDVSNSFVKKVASRVSELLPQSIWPTKWFSSPNNEIHPQGNGREALNSPLTEKAEDTSPIPAKRARIPLNSSFSEPFFTSENTASDFESHRLRHTIPNINAIEDGLGEPIAGPSGIQRQFQPMGSSESSVPKARDSLSYNTKKIEINGEDHSDSSESTSGCSSLPQGDCNTEIRNVNRPESKASQVEIHEQPSIRTSVKRRFSESANYKSTNLEGGLYSDKYGSMTAQGSRPFLGLGGYSPPNRTMPVPVGRRRKPSFNPDVFGFQNWSGEKTNIKDRIVNSPFYSGRTTYGGVSAYQTSLNKSATQSVQEGRRSIQVRPKNISQVKENSTNISSTARRIMEALEMFSSPIQDAKKIPLHDSIHIRRRKVIANPDFSHSSLHSSQSSNLTMQNSTRRYSGEMAPPVKELMVPTVPDILAMQRRQRLQGSTVAARQAVSETSMLPSAENVNRSDHLTISYVDNRSSGRVGGKIKSKEEIDQEPVEEPNLPAIPLPITSLPKFDFVLPPLCPPQQPPKQVDSQISKPAGSMSFKFSSPIAFSGASEMPVSSNNFTFSSPLKALSKTAIDASTSKVNLSSSVVSGSSAGSIDKEKHSQCTKTSTQSKGNISQYKGNWTSSSSEPKVSGGGGDSSRSVNQGNLQFSAGSKLSENSSFGDKFKPAAGSWECEACMVRNNGDVSKCVACETQRSCKVGAASSTKTIPAVCSGFGNSFKPPSGSWTCDTCLVTNPSTASKCQACETPRVKEVKASSVSEGSKVDNKIVESGFGDKFKKPEGDWDCSICLVRNKAGGPQKCVACDAPKPGTEPVKATSLSGPKFSFGSPVPSGFNFGIDKADLPKKEDPAGNSKPSFTFGNPSTTPASGFTFGVNNASDGAAKEKVAEVAGFVFGSSSTADSTDGAKKSNISQSPPKITFGFKESTEKNPTNESTSIKAVIEINDDTIKTADAKPAAETESKNISGNTNSPTGTGFGIPALSSKPLLANETKSTFSFASSEEGKKEPTTNSSTFSFGGNSTVTKPADEEKKAPSVAFSSPSSSPNTQSVFGAGAVGSGWNANTPFKLDSTPKPSIFSKSTSALGSSNNPSAKVEGNTNAGTSTFKFGDSSKAEASTKLPEVPSTLSSNFKFQESPKASIFKFEEKPKTSLSGLPSLPTSTFATNPFSSGGFGAASKEKAPVSSTTPVSTAASSTSVGNDLTAAKTTTAGLFVFGKGASSTAVSSTSISTDTAATKSSSPGLFMFGSGTSSQPTAFNVTEQKQLAPTTSASTTTTEQPGQPLSSSIGSTPNIFGNVIPKPSVFGSSSSAPSPSSAASLLTGTKSEALSSANTTFASPTSSSMFGSSVSSSVTASATPATTTTVSSTSTTFGSSIFGTASTSFSTVGSAAPTPAFGSAASASLAAPSGFGAPQTSSVFGIGSSTSSTTPFSFTASAKSTTEEQPRPQAANAPFVFGGGAAAAAPAAQPFTFNAAPSKPVFPFGSSSVGSQPTVGGSAPASAAPSAPVLGGFSFGDTSKGPPAPFGSSQPATSIAGGTVNPFGSPPAAPVANITPAAPAFGAPIGEGNAASSGTFGATPAFNFGSSQSNSVFSFNSNQANVAQSPAFSFGQTPQQNSAPQVTFNPNMPPSFNFTGGATPQFTATPGVLNSVPAANTLPRRIKKAVRRTQQPR